jgi:hypothetical protein
MFEIEEHVRANYQFSGSLANREARFVRIQDP